MKRYCEKTSVPRAAKIVVELGWSVLGAVILSSAVDVLTPQNRWTSFSAGVIGAFAAGAISHAVLNVQDTRDMVACMATDA